MATILDAERKEILKSLDRATTCTQRIFGADTDSKLKMVTRYPKKSFLRKIIVGLLGQRHHFVLKSKTFFGATMYVNNYEQHLWFCGVIPSPAEIRLTKYIIAHLKTGEDEVFFDIGTHHGFYTLLVNTITHGLTPVHAFEPARLHFRILSKSLRGLKNVFANNCAVYSKDGSIRFFENNRSVSTVDESVTRTPSNRRLRFEPVEVESITLDRYCLERNVRPTFLKIDAEGAEKDVLAGGLNIIADCHPVIAMEVWKENNLPHTAAIELLAAAGYRMFAINENGELFPVTSDVLAGIPDGEFDNFIFKHS